MPSKAPNIVATVERNVVVLRQGADVLVLHCASRQHAEILGQALVEGVGRFEADIEPRFMVVDESNAAPDDQPATFHILSDQLKANVDDPDYCAWLRVAKLGERYSNGGGAAPLITTWRV